ncbi:putative wall-associated receptor kinase-like 16 isoform X2 [Punica granatum]|uniref:Wall-associated receptor kinase-like 16 isoform X2 n=1 Tax=Punica granatum TaxID=22663 RepID=A0A6P8C0D2_PUNGR|nr:putative wall-associated receptor kinase-like 16 isoform X2 [Punica granatum]
MVFPIPKRDFRQVLFPAVILTVVSLVTAASSNCQTTCGNVTIPYPFGTARGCYLNRYFYVRCNDSAPGGPTLQLWGAPSVKVLSISLSGELRVNTYIGRDCYTQSGARRRPVKAYAILPAFPFSTTKNKFTAVGCDTFAMTNGDDANSSITEGTCNGIGCCQTAVPKMLLNYNASVSSFRNHTQVWSFNPCSYAFIIETDSFNFTREDLSSMRNWTRVPSVLDWSIWNQTCRESQKDPSTFACKANSECFDHEDIRGYRCNCSAGYQGNPYISDGCQDIDECANPEDNQCEKVCHNTPGNYTCSCPSGYHGDGRRDGEGCIVDQSHVIKIVVGVGVGFIVLLFMSGFLYFGSRRRKLMRLKEKYFQQNGGLLLQQQLHQREGHTSTMRIFTTEELQKATDNYAENRIVGQGGYGTVYKGILPNDIIIAIKKSKVLDQNQIEQFINEVIVLSQINHRNVVKLLGCCLETEVPLLVYEFVGNRTLFEHIHGQTEDPKLSWETRLRIAVETAGVLSYLHSAASVPIIHRDIKSTNILLDENCIAKVSDFGASRLVPLDHTQLYTMVQGTLGYLDPEYLHTNTLTEKSDVYSFGVVLVELLTGKKALSFDRPEEERSLAMHFLHALKEDRLFQIVEDCLLSENNTEQLRGVAGLTKKCLRVKGDERPSMTEVAMELEGLRVMGSHPWVSIELDMEEETVHLLGKERPESLMSYTESMDMSSVCDSNSMRNQQISPVNNGR